MTIIHNYFGSDVSAVQVFHAPKPDKWVLRVVSRCSLLHGDLFTDEEPTDEELRAAFGDAKILRGYSLAAIIAQVLPPEKAGELIRRVEEAAQWAERTSRAAERRSFASRRRAACERSSERRQQ